MFAHVKFIKYHQLKIVDVKETQVLNGECVKEKQICRVMKNGEYDKAIVLRLGAQNGYVLEVLTPTLGIAPCLSVTGSAGTGPEEPFSLDCDKKEQVKRTGPLVEQ
uniref:Uncharacterized protein n=1 Tax=Timema monikensis TaxID=170555 RepID=A0A7R9HR18_9NEOP|nr:unnamed protein product [Timema monikensis]